MTTDTGWRQARYSEPMLNELASTKSDAWTGRALRAFEAGWLPQELARKSALTLPDVPEPRVVRHYTRLSEMNFGIDSGPYPLGSCTMKYNPKVNEEVAANPKFARLHPASPALHAQGMLEIMHKLQLWLAAISGMHSVTIQPAAGAQGEWTAMLITRAYHASRGESRRHEVVVPDSAHGTNPASAAMAGYDVVEIHSKDGAVDLDALRAAVSKEKTAAFMITNPSTLGLFERNIGEVAKIVHEAGALLYYDGANFNAILGKTNPAIMGFDMVHFNLHKTFSTPHGGGGPGAGPIGVVDKLAPFLPVPLVGLKDGKYFLDYERPQSIGRVKGYWGNGGMFVRGYTYIRLFGADGLAENTETAVLNANYIHHKLKDLYPTDVSPASPRMHETVLSGVKVRDSRGLRVADIAKRMLDYGIHAPTVYFPQIVEEAIMIEPTETETKEDLDAIIAALRTIATEDPEVVRSAPHNTAVARVDEVEAARRPILTWKDA
jgi:glycine dehydrogenase subunit 2